MRYLLLLALLFSSRAKAYIPEEVWGTWSNVRNESYIEFSDGTDSDSLNKGIVKGFFHSYSGGNYSYDGEFTLRADVITLHYSMMSNKIDKKQLNITDKQVML